MKDESSCEGFWYDKTCPENRRYCPGVERIDDPVCVVLESTTNNEISKIVRIFCSSDVLSMRSDFFKILISKSHIEGTPREVTLADDDVDSAASFLEFIHKLCVDDMHGLQWNKAWAELAIKWSCPEFISAFSEIIPRRLNDILSLHWIPLRDTLYKEKPLSLVGCEIEHWQQGVCHGVITAAFCSASFYIQTIGADESTKIHLGSAPENCRVLTQSSTRKQEEIRVFWELVDILLTYPELQKDFPSLNDSKLSPRGRSGGHKRDQQPVQLKTTSDLAHLLAAPQQWGLWDREHMTRLLNKDDLLDICEAIRSYGEPPAGFFAESTRGHLSSSISDFTHRHY